MTVPNVSSFGSMGVSANYSGKIDGCVDTPKEALVKEKVAGAEKQMGAMADAFIRQDNSPADLCAELGKVVLAQHDAKTGDVGVIMEFDPASAKPKKMVVGDEAGKAEMSVEWSGCGNIANMKQVRNLGDHVETVSITTQKPDPKPEPKVDGADDRCAKVLLYEETYQKLTPPKA